MDDIILKVSDLKKHFPAKKGFFGKTKGHVKAVDGVSFEINKGETLGLVGESGCGKTTTGRCILRLIDPTSGNVTFNYDDFLKLEGEDLLNARQKMQAIFQDPYSSLNPRKMILDIVGEAMVVHGLIEKNEKKDKVAELLEKVGLSKKYINRYPHEFSGGQRQRIGIARALALNPSLIICDEAVSALDVSVQAQVINLLMKLQDEYKLSYLFIAHDLSVVKHISHKIAVMYLGKIVEMATSDELFSDPKHPYTKSLLSAVPNPDPANKPQRQILQGDVPSPFNPPSGCPFHPRCADATSECSIETPVTISISPSHYVNCRKYL